MVTVTARAKNHRFGTTLEAIIANWDKLLKRLKRQWGEFQYVRVYERHKSGEFHAHMLVSYYPSDSELKTSYRAIKGIERYRGSAHKELKRHSWESGLGFIVDFSPIRHGDIEDYKHKTNRIVAYVTKYMTKGLGDLPHGTRRVQTSRLIGTNKDMENNDVWILRHFIYETDIDDMGKILDVSRKYDVTYDDFERAPVYPIDNDQY
jgi:hypothetical protein